MSILKSVWTLLTEDPSKDISKGSKKEVLKMDVKKEHPVVDLTENPKLKKREKKEPTLIERLYALKNSTFNHSDVIIKEIEDNSYNRYDYGYGGRRRSYYDYDTNENSYIIKLQISGRTIFNRVVPDFPGLTERHIMSREGNTDFTSGILNIGDKNMKVQKINLILKVGCDKRLLPEGTSFKEINMTFYKSEIVSLSVIRETLSGQVSIRDIGVDQRASNTDLNGVIFGYNDVIKNLIVSDFERELDLHRKKDELSKIVKVFNDNINKDVLSDLFTYSFDEIGNCSIEKKNEKDYRYYVPGINDHWEVEISISDLRNNDSDVSFNMNEKLSNLLIEIGEAVNRIKSIYSGCNVELDMSQINNSRLIIKVSPDYPEWLSNERNKRQSEGRARRTIRNYDILHYRGYQDYYE